MDYVDEYIKIHPSLHAEDAALKFEDLGRALGLLPPCSSLLDVGCGSGHLLVRVANFLKPTRALGIDLSKSGIEFARKQHQNQNIDWQCLNVFDLNFEQRWDLIILSDVLEHVEKDIDLLKFLLTKAHFVLIRVPIEDNLVNWAFRKFSNFDPWEDSRKRYGHVHHYSVENLIRLTKTVGSNVLDISLYPLRKRGVFWFELIRLVFYPLFWMSPSLSVKLNGGFTVLLIALPKPLDGRNH